MSFSLLGSMPAPGSSTVFAFVHTPLLLKFPALCFSHQEPHPLLCSVASAASSRDKMVSVRGEAGAEAAGLGLPGERAAGVSAASQAAEGESTGGRWGVHA